MSINFTSDIDGATSGSGITKITVGGKTINLSEVGGNAGNGVVSGTFTPTGNETEFAIDTGIDFSVVAFLKKSETLGYGHRVMQAYFWDRTLNMFARISTNSSGDADAGIFGVTVSDTVTEKSGSANVAVKDGTNFVILPVSAVGMLCPEEYVWYAW